MSPGARNGPRFRKPTYPVAPQLKLRRRRQTARPGAGENCSNQALLSKKEASSDLKTATATTTLSASAIGRDRSHVLDATNLQASASQRPECRLTTRSWSLGSLATCPTDLDVQSSNSKLFTTSRDILGSEHRRVRRGLISVSLHLHATGDTHESLASSQVSNMNEGVIVRGIDVGDAKHQLVLLQLLCKRREFFVSCLIRHTISRCHDTRDARDRETYARAPTHRAHRVHTARSS